MKKFIKYLKWVPFAICLGSLVIYLIYTIRIKLNPAIIVTESLISALNTYLIIALISLFIGLLIILIQKIYKLTKQNNYIKEEKVVYTYPKEEKTIITEEKKDDVVTTKEEKIIEKEPIVVKEKVIIENGVNCPECNNKISKSAAICPYCGILFDKEILKVIKKYEKKEYKVNPIITIANILLTIIFIILILLICNYLYNRYNDNLQKISSIVQRQ